MVKSRRYYFSFFLFLILIFGLSPNIIFAQRVQPSFSKHIITDELRLAKKFEPADIDNDGDLDLVTAASNWSVDTANVAWWENDGTENFSEHVLAYDFYTARGIHVADMQNDGNLDILVGSNGRRPLTLFVNDGSGGWTTRTIGVRDCTIYSISTIDFDEDGYLDIAATYANQFNDIGGDAVRWFENNGDLTFTEHTLVSSYENATGVCIADYNNDGSWDILTSAFGEIPVATVPSTWPNVGVNDSIAWWANNGNQIFQQNVVTVPADFQSPNDVCSSDLNNDGYPDILVASYFAGFNYTGPGFLLSGGLAWWSNDGTGNFGSIQPLYTDFTFARSIKGKDIDGDGDTDVVGAADRDSTILWLENDGTQSFTTHVLTNTFTYAYYALPADFDGDGDMDIIGSAQNAYEVSWWENHQEDERLITGNDPDTVRFWGDKVIIDFSAGSAGSQDSTTVFYNAGNNLDINNLGTGINHIAQKGFYTITTRRSGYTASVDFYYGDIVEWSAINNDDELVICWWDDANSQWIEAGTSQIVNPDQSITVNGISTTPNNEFRIFSKWTIGSRTSDNPLPVQLLAFSAEILSDGIKLNWSTASEINNVGFEIWRSEGSDSNYILLSDYRFNENLIGAGNSNKLRDYSYTDLNVTDNFTYHYKLVDVDVNNRKTVHSPLEVTFIRISIATSFQLEQNYPNPFNGYTKIPIYLKSQSLSGSASGTLQIFNLLGERIRNYDLHLLSSGLNEIQWDGRDNSGNMVASGQYYYRVDLNGESQNRKLILIR